MSEEKMVPEKFKDLVAKIETMSVLDLSELVKVLEVKFGVSAAMPITAMPIANGAGAGAEAVEEKSSFSVELTSAGEQKIQVIKVLRDALGLGLKEAKDMTDGAPIMVKEGVDKKTAEEIIAKITAGGGKAVLK